MTGWCFDFAAIGRYARRGRIFQNRTEARPCHRSFAIDHQTCFNDTLKRGCRRRRIASA